MRKYISKFMMVLSLAVMLILSLSVIASAAVQTTWYLSKDGASGISGSDTYYKMVTSAGGGNPAISINKGNSVVWVDGPASATVTEPSGDWTGTIYNKTHTDKYSVEIAVGICTSAGDFNSQKAVNVLLPKKAAYNFTLSDVPSFTVDSGEFVAFRIKNIDTRTGSVVIKDGTVTNPQTSGSPPVPELPAVALLGLGLAGVGAFVYLKRRGAAASV